MDEYATLDAGTTVPIQHQPGAIAGDDEGVYHALQRVSVNVEQDDDYVPQSSSAHASDGVLYDVVAPVPTEHDCTDLHDTTSYASLQNTMEMKEMGAQKGSDCVYASIVAVGAPSTPPIAPRPVDMEASGRDKGETSDRGRCKLCIIIVSIQRSV